MRFAERLLGNTHATDAQLLATVAGEPASDHVSSCDACRGRLAALGTWVEGTAAEAGQIADEIFTAERLESQRARIFRRLETAGRSARVISFPAGAPPASPAVTPRLIRWAAAAAFGGLMVGLGSGLYLFDAADAPAPRAATSTTAAAPAAVPSARTGDSALEALDEEGLLNAAYERVDVDALRTIDDITPRAREVVINLPRRMP